MVKNIIIVILVILVVAEGVMLFQSHQQLKQQTAMTQKTFPPAGPHFVRRGGVPLIMSKGMNLKTSPLFKYAYPIAPTLPDSSKKVLVGFNLNSQKQSDGSVTVLLTPKDSDDQSQQYTIKSGQTVYFIEQTPVDDKGDQDKDLNYRDDYGIIVDSTGVIQ